MIFASIVSTNPTLPSLCFTQLCESMDFVDTMDAKIIRAGLVLKSYITFATKSGSFNVIVVDSKDRNRPLPRFGHGLFWILFVGGAEAAASRLLENGGESVSFPDDPDQTTYPFNPVRDPFGFTWLFTDISLPVVSKITTFHMIIPLIHVPDYHASGAADLYTRVFGGQKLLPFTVTCVNSEAAEAAKKAFVDGWAQLLPGDPEDPVGTPHLVRDPYGYIWMVAAPV